MELDPSSLLQSFRAHTLPKPAWTHEAHVIVCWATLQEMDADAALVALRDGIRAYNSSVGTPNNDSDGYHETLTRYYVHVVAALADRPIEEVLAHASCSRTAPLDHWSREALFSVAARRDWLPPDLTPLG
ncbi:MAG: hypothetical protein U0Q03_16700 [Acidimicrobiales bacterium]